MACPVVSTPSERTRSWWRKHFHDHPKLSQKHAEAYSNPRTKDKPKVWCKLCFPVRIAAEKQSDSREVAEGKRDAVREERTITDYFWACSANDPARGWLTARSDTLLIHLCDCTLQPSAIVQSAMREPSISRHTAHPSVPVSDTTAMDWQSSTLMAPVVPQTNFGASYSPHIPGSPSFLLTGPSGLPSAGPSIHPGTIPAQRDSLPPSPLSTVFPSPFNASPSPPVISSSLAPHYEEPTKRLRRSRSHRSASQLGHSEPVWDNNRQKRFEERTVRITASAGLPLHWVENPEWLGFLEDFVPAGKPPSRKVLTQRLLPSALSVMRANAKAEASGHHATVECDGWTGENHHHFIAFMMTADQKVHTVRVHDASNERKTAENLLALMLEVIQVLEEEWHVTIVAFTTDASGESRKARKMLLEKFPHLVAPDCYAHQVNLVVGDYFKVKESEFLVYAEQACDLITWLRSKTFVLALIREELIAANKAPLTVIRAVLTRWTAHYLAFRRLLQLQKTLQILALKDDERDEKERQLVPYSGNAKTKALAHKNVATIKDALFWISIARIKNHLEPLAIAANIAQSAFCRLDEVILTFGALVMRYSSLDDSDCPEVEAILSSIERRWAKSDQEIFIAAVILNPFLKISPFCRLSFLTPAGILMLLKRLWRRFYNEDAPLELYSNLNDYLNSEGIFEGINDYCDTIEAVASEKGQSPDLLAVYGGLIHKGDPNPPPLYVLSKHILSICANSASCERLFSVFGNILTKLRNRLGTESLVSLAELKMHLRNEHARNDAKTRLKRMFGEDKQSGAHPTTAPPIPSTSTPVETSSGPSIALGGIVGSSGAAETPADTADVPTSEPSVAQDLRGITAGFSCMVDDDVDKEPVQFPSKISIGITQLFDFEQKHWVDKYERNAHRSLNDELAFYELMDLDAAGEIDTTFSSVDETIDTVLGT